MKRNTSLDSFIRSKATDMQPGEPEVDWQARKNDWLMNIAALYAQVRKWLEQLEKENVVSFRVSNVSIEEDYIGSYNVDVLTLFIGKQKVAFNPKGTLIVGAQGRVDIRGQAALRTVILREGSWHLVERSPKLKVVPFNQESFREVLSEVME